MMDRINVRIDDQTRRALEAAAQRDDRHTTALARLLIKEGLSRRGYHISTHGDDRQNAGGQGVQHDD